MKPHYFVSFVIGSKFSHEILIKDEKKKKKREGFKGILNVLKVFLMDLIIKGYDFKGFFFFIVVSITLL